MAPIRISNNEIKLTKHMIPPKLFFEIINTLNLRLCQLYKKNRTEGSKSKTYQNKAFLTLTKQIRNKN